MVKRLHMKRIYILFGIVLTAFSCNKDTKQQLIEWVFEAPTTKANLSADGSFSWTPGDQINLWDAAGSSFVTFTTASGSGRFSAQAPASAHFSGAAFYPATIATTNSSVTLPASYSTTALSTGAGMPMYAQVSEGSNLLHFKHLGAYLTVQLNQVPASMDQIRISSPTVSLSGVFPLTEISGYKVLQATDGSGDILVSFPHTGVQNIVLTIPVPVGEYSIRYSAGSAGNPDVLQKYTDAIVFQRAHLYKLSPAAHESAFTPLTCEAFQLNDDNNNWE